MGIVSNTNVIPSTLLFNSMTHSHKTSSVDKNIKKGACHLKTSASPPLFLTRNIISCCYSVRFLDFPPEDFLFGDDVGRGVGTFVGPVGTFVGTGVGPVGA